MFDVVYITLLGLVLAWLLTGPGGWRHHRSEGFAGAWLFVVLVLLPVLWLAMVWVPPAGPAISGVAWLMPLVVGLLVVFLLASVSPPPRRRLGPNEEPKAGQQQRAAETGPAAIFVDALFWLFLALAAALLIIGVAT